MKLKINIVFLILFFIITINVTLSYAVDEENTTNQVVGNTINENNTIKDENEISQVTEKQNDKNEIKETNSIIKKDETSNNKIIKSTYITFNYTHTGNLKSKQYIRKKANMKSKKKICINKGKKVTILSEKSDFYKIQYKKGKKKYKGYIKKKHIDLNANISINQGKEKKLNPTILPKNSTDKIKFKTSNKNIATIDSTGKIIAKKKGKVVITATTESGKKDYVVINIKKANSSKQKEYMKLNQKAYNISKQYKNVTRTIYGKSVLGENLESYEIKGNGTNSKVMFIEFGLHGYEDEYPKDAKVLIKLANNVIKYYANNPEKLMDFTLVIVPCANPDGVLYGKNNYREDKKNAFGRCTAKGIDMNRDFKEDKYKAKETKALKKLLNKYKDRIKINIDVHGWEDSVLGKKKLVEAFIKYIGNKVNKTGQYGGNRGYIINYTRKVLKAYSALVEFKNSKSVNENDFEEAINFIVTIY